MMLDSMISEAIRLLGNTVEEATVSEEYNSATVIVPDPLRFLERVERVERLMYVELDCIAEQGKGSCLIRIRP
jgi:hypothetical protein